MAAFSALLLILLSTGTHGAGLHGNTVRGMQQIGSRGLHRAVRPLDVNRKTLKTTTRLKARNDDAMRRELEKITTPTATGEKSMKGKGKLNDFAEQMTTRMASRETTTTAMVSLLVLASLVHGAPAHAFDIFDDDWIRNFKVDVAGFEIDHRVLVEGVVGGQFIGFVGALVTAQKNKQDQTTRNQIESNQITPHAPHMQGIHMQTRVYAREIRT
uniref:PS II complex 12 kDa extrinsic protein n=1 Tax=Lotharella globosa TaxID=91324 RepID=A0A6V3NL14_9EUKA